MTYRELGQDYTAEDVYDWFLTEKWIESEDVEDWMYQDLTVEDIYEAYAWEFRDDPETSIFSIFGGYPEVDGSVGYVGFSDVPEELAGRWYLDCATGEVSHFDR